MHLVCGCAPSVLNHGRMNETCDMFLIASKFAPFVAVQFWWRKHRAQKRSLAFHLHCFHLTHHQDDVAAMPASVDDGLLGSHCRLLVFPLTCVARRCSSLCLPVAALRYLVSHQPPQRQYPLCKTMEEDRCCDGGDGHPCPRPC